MGVISRDGWVLLDDTRTARFDGAADRGGWDWAAPVDVAEAAAEMHRIRSTRAAELQLAAETARARVRTPASFLRVWVAYL